MANKIDELSIPTGTDLNAEDRLRAILDSSPIGVGISDIESGTVKYVNDKNLEIMGVKREDFLGNSAKNFWVNLADRDEFVEAFRRDGRVSREVRQKKADGSLIWCVLTWERSPVAAKEVIFWVHDITELKKARDEAKHFQNELVRHRDHLAELVEERTGELVTVTDNLPALITRLDAEQRYVFVNKTAEQWFAQKAGQILGRTVKENLGDTAYKTLAPLLDKALAGEPQKFERTLTYPEGVTRDVEISYLPDIGPHGNINGLFSLVADISERKRVERELKQSTDLLVQAEEIAKIGHWKWDDDGQKMLSCSQQAATIFGLSQEELLAKAATHAGYLELIFADDRKVVDHAIGVFYEGFREDPAKSKPLDLEYRIIRPDGRIRFVQERAEPITDDRGIVSRSVGAIRDITDRKRAEEALRLPEPDIDQSTRLMLMTK